MDTSKIAVHCDSCKALMMLRHGRTCFGEHFRRYECLRCGNAREEALVLAEIRATRQAA